MAYRSQVGEEYDYNEGEQKLLIGLQNVGISFKTYVEICVQYTIPDAFVQRGIKRSIPVYLDGPPHLKKKAQQWDPFVDKQLKRMGYNPLRFQYKPPLSNKLRDEIVEEIRKAM